MLASILIYNFKKNQLTFKIVLMYIHVLLKYEKRECEKPR